MSETTALCEGLTAFVSKKKSLRFIHPTVWCSHLLIGRRCATGVLAAIAVAASDNADSLIQNAAIALSMAFWVGYHYQESAHQFVPSEEVASNASACNIVLKPMLSIVNASTARVRHLIASINAGVVFVA